MAELAEMEELCCLLDGAKPEVRPPSCRPNLVLSPLIHGATRSSAPQPGPPRANHGHIQPEVPTHPRETHLPIIRDEQVLEVNPESMKCFSCPHRAPRLEAHVYDFKEAAI